MGYVNLDGEVISGKYNSVTKTPDRCDHKDNKNDFTVVIVDGEYEHCTQCGLTGK